MSILGCNEDKGNGGYCSISERQAEITLRLIAQQIESLQVRHEETSRRLENRLDSYEAKIDTLMADRNRWMGGLAVLLALGGALTYVINTLLGMVKAGG